MDEDKGRLINTEGFTKELSNGAKVRVAFDTARTDDCYYFRFTSKAGNETRLKLSREAYEAIIEAKPKIDMRRDTGSCAMWAAITSDKP